MKSLAFETKTGGNWRQRLGEKNGQQQQPLILHHFTPFYTILHHIHMNIYTTIVYSTSQLGRHLG